MRIFLVAGLVILGLGRGVAATELTEDQKERNAGYALFHNLCEEESQVDMIMLVKDAPDVIGKYTKELSAQAKASLDTMDKLRSMDRTIRFEPDPLPLFERDVREEIKEDKRDQLVDKTSGPAFVRALIVTQVQACQYAKVIAQQLADRTKGPAQKKMLLELAAKWGALGDKGYDLLGSKVAR